MESLESKLDRLSPEQRKEIEDFVDFLLLRSGGLVRTPTDSPCNPPPVLHIAPPPLPPAEPVHAIETRPVVGLRDLARPEDLVASAAGDEVIPVPFQEIGGSSLDWISRDYMDYGQFEKQCSAATEAVRKVKAKLDKAEDREKPRHLLDWVD